MLKCSRFSLSAPTDSLAEPNNDNRNKSDDWNGLSRGSPGIAYVSEDDDLGKTGVVFQFRRSIKSDNTEIEARRRSAIDKGFMRFGRSRNMVRFGRSNPDTIQYEADVNDNNDLERNDNEVNEPFSMRMRKGNMMRFGRGNMMRFGRGYADTDFSHADLDYDNNDASEIYDFIAPPVRRNPENKYDEHGKKILRLGRSSSESYSDENYDIPQQYSLDKSNEREKKPIEGNVLRFGRSDKGNLLRFGRGENMMRFGRGNMMRFGRGNMMRFGRGNMMRFGKRDKGIYSEDRDFMRTAKSGGNVMRFGKRSPKAIATSSKIYCEDNNCFIQEKENRLLENTENDDKQTSENTNNNNNNINYDQLNSLFGDDDTKSQGYGEYIITKK